MVIYNYNSTFLSWVIGIMLLLLGFKIGFTQLLPIGGSSGYVDIGNYAYIVALLFIGYGLRILYYLVYQKKGSKKEKS